MRTLFIEKLIVHKFCYMIFLLADETIKCYKEKCNFKDWLSNFSAYRYNVFITIFRNRDVLHEKFIRTFFVKNTIFYYFYSVNYFAHRKIIELWRKK